MKEKILQEIAEYNKQIDALEKDWDKIDEEIFKLRKVRSDIDDIIYRKLTKVVELRDKLRSIKE